MKRILEIKEIEPGIIEIKLEATKRRKLRFKVDKSENFSCSESCPLYQKCSKLPSPLYPKYPKFGNFCSQLYNEYPGLAFRLVTEFGVLNINQLIPIEKKREDRQ